MTRVKVCGITRIEDATVASELGAYAVGFIFWPGSTRCVDPQVARAIVDSLPGEVLKVGVFVDQPVEDVRRIVSATNLDAVQLHGDEDPSYIRQLELRVVKAVPVTRTFAPSVLDALPDDVLVLLDSHDPVRRGGTGQTIDWSLAAAAAARRPVILSGGLHPDNAAEAVTQVRPYAIDLSSGVESAPGVKDHAKLRALFDSLRHD